MNAIGVLNKWDGEIDVTLAGGEEDDDGDDY